MDVVWKSVKPLKPADVQLALGDKLAYTTIQTELKRLVDKKLLKRKQVGKVYLYTSARPKEEFAGCLCGVYRGLVGSYGHLAISQFVDTIKQNKEDLEMLKSYLRKS